MGENHCPDPSLSPTGSGCFIARAGTSSSASSEHDPNHVESLIAKATQVTEKPDLGGASVLFDSINLRYELADDECGCYLNLTKYSKATETIDEGYVLYEFKDNRRTSLEPVHIESDGSHSSSEDISTKPVQESADKQEGQELVVSKLVWINHPSNFGPITPNTHQLLMQQEAEAGPNYNTEDCEEHES